MMLFFCPFWILTATVYIFTMWGKALLLCFI